MKINKKIINIATSAFLLWLAVIAISTAKAENLPGFPMAFWGTVTINSSPAPVGTVVRAYYGSVLAGTATVQESGVYGYTESIKQKLIVGEGAGVISFTFQSASINGGSGTSGCAAVSYAGFTSGLTVEKDLAFNTTGCGGSVDGAPPVITLIGGNVTIYQGSTYVDAGATALDNVDGDITANIVVNPCGYGSGTGLGGGGGGSGGGGGGSCYMIFVSGPIDGPATSGGRTHFITYNVSDAAGNHAVQVAREVTELWFSSSQLLSENTTVNTSTSNILVGDNNTASSIITIPDSVTNATINVATLTTSSAASTTATIQGAITINASTTIGAVNVEIPAGIQIVAGTPAWSGIINVPQVQLNSTVTATPDSGNTAAVSSVIEIGYGDTKLTFNKAVRIKITDQAGKYVGYSRNGVFTPITNVCSADSQVAGDALPPEGDCKINVGSDLIVWTKHFTNFVTYTQTAIPTPTPAPSGGSSGGGGGGYYLSPTPTTTTVPVITSALTPGKVLGTAAFNFTGSLSLGLRGNDVTELQKLLLSEGVYNGPITGYFGQLTFAGVKAYQAKHGISPTGTVGPLTRAQLNSGQVVLGASTSAGTEALKAQIAALQAQLVILLQKLAEILQTKAPGQ